MPKVLLQQVRQLQQLLKEKLIPFAQNGAPLILFDAPPRSSTKLNIRFEDSPRLSSQKRSRAAYPQIRIWPKEQINSVSVPVIGCIFEGEVDYDVRHLQGAKRGRWIVPIKAGTLFGVTPNIPFTRDKVAWERSSPEEAHARGIFMHLRHDGVRCQTFSLDKGKLWPHPYLFLYQPDALFMGEKLLAEMQQMNADVAPITHYYWLLIFHLLLQSIETGRFATTKSPMTISDMEEEHFTSHATSETRVRLAEDFIQNHLGDSSLNPTKIAEHCGLSSRHLARLFQSETKIALMQYIQQHRLEKACELLQSSFLSVGDVASYCGFKQLSNFSTWFTQHKGCSPSAYRNQLAKRNGRNP